MADTRDILLRIDPALFARIDKVKWTLQVRESRDVPRSWVLERMLELGCALMERSFEETTAPAPEPPAPAPTPVAPLAPITPMQEPDPKLVAIADIWAEYKALGYEKVAQLLYDRGIYRAKSKDGTEHVMNRGTLMKMVKRCERLGLL